MKQTRLIMGMPITVEIVDKKVSSEIFATVFSYFHHIDEKFSTYKKASEISLINSGKLSKDKYSTEMKIILSLSKETKKQTGGFFDIKKNGKLDPSGIVKGYAIYNASEILKKMGFKSFYIEAGGDIEAVGLNKNKKWKIGIRNPFKLSEIVKVVLVTNKGVATSGTYERGSHIYNPKSKNEMQNDVVSLTVIGPNIYDADRFATAAFAMGRLGINFIESLSGFDGYMIDKKGIATFTSNFYSFTI